MFSVCLKLTCKFRHAVMAYLGLLNDNMFCEDENEPAIWSCSFKLPPNGEGLADKGFEFVDRFFSYGVTG